MAPSIVYDGEVIVSELSGVYLGNFGSGAAIDAPLGFSRSQSTPYGGWMNGAIDWVISPWWEPPNTFEYNAAAAGTLGKQPDLPIGLTQFGLLNGGIVYDPTGPDGWEDHLAVELDGSGTGYQDSFYFIGDTASRRSYLNIPDYEINPWQPALFSYWTFECYARAVPDDNGYLMSGCTLGFGYSQPGFDISRDAPAGALAADWQFFRENVFIFWQLGYPFTLPGIWVETPPNNETRHVSDGIFPPADYTKYARKGRFRIKEFHVYPQGAPQITPGAHLKTSSR